MNKVGYIIFDIDGVIRDVSRSYRLAIKKTVSKYCGWEPNSSDIDKLKHEGIWNNDWDLSLELIKRYIESNKLKESIPKRIEIIKLFEKLYFGCDPNRNDYKYWNGFIKNEKLLVRKTMFEELTNANIGWGFVSGAEKVSAKYVLENELKLENPPLIAMGDAPDKPNPKGFIKLAEQLSKTSLDHLDVPVVYVGDTITDIQTLINAKNIKPQQKFLSVGVIPPHLESKVNNEEKESYALEFKKAGADYILQSIQDIDYVIHDLFLSEEGKKC